MSRQLSGSHAFRWKKEKKYRLERPGNLYKYEAVPSRMKPFHWRDNCNGQIRRRPCIGTIRHEIASYPDRGLVYTPCNAAPRPQGASAPIRRPLFECSWFGSIAGRSSVKQADRLSEKPIGACHAVEPCFLACTEQDAAPYLVQRCAALSRSLQRQKGTRLSKG